MILYNVTVSIDENVADEWLVWMKDVHIPDVMKTGIFTESRICKILAHEEGGLSYSVQYLAASMDDYERYEREHAPALQQDHTSRYQGKFAAFRTLLRVEESFKI
jgi:hypothetical protein